MVGMSTKSRHVIYGSRIAGATIRVEEARKRAVEADRADAEAWSIRMEGYGGPAQPSPIIAQCLNGGLHARLSQLDMFGNERPLFRRGK
jgi:hypothetical protein